MAMNWKTFGTRTGTAIIFGAVMLCGLFLSPISFWLLFALVQFLCIQEYLGLLQHKGVAIPGVLARIALQLWALLLVSTVAIDAMAAQKGMLAVLIILPAFFLLSEGLRKGGSAFAMLTAAGCVLYIVLPITSLMLLYKVNTWLPAGLIFLIWINDTMAYVVGSFIGKTPFSEISPKKTWEGTGGGALLTIAVAAAYGSFSRDLPLQACVALAFIAAVAGTMGDLFESKLKREAGVKDSGSFMPGHGGALDRFDSLLLSAPFAYAYAVLFLQ